MTLTRKDAAATVLTALAVLAYVATRESWNVWLIGSSHRWAAGAATKLSGIGVASLVTAVWAVWTASLTPLSLLVVSIVVLWAGSTLRHAWHPAHGPLPI